MAPDLLLALITQKGERRKSALKSRAPPLLPSGGFHSPMIILRNVLNITEDVGVWSWLVYTADAAED